jgi:hypothetical protein
VTDQPRNNRPADQTRQPGADLIGDLQRWLIRSSAKNMRREIGGQVRKKLGADRSEPRDVWDTATTEPAPGDLGEAPECAWCPICRAARKIRESGPGFGSQLAGAGDAVAAAVQEALGAVDTVLSRPGTGSGADRPRHPAEPGPAAAGPSGPAASGSGPAASGSGPAEPGSGPAEPGAAASSAGPSAPAAAHDDDPSGNHLEGPPDYGPDDRS